MNQNTAKKDVECCRSAFDLRLYSSTGIKTKETMTMKTNNTIIKEHKQHSLIK